MGFLETTHSKTALLLSVFSIAWFISSMLWAYSEDPVDNKIWTLFQGFATLIILVSWSEFMTNYKEEKSQKKKAKQRLERWKTTWKGEPTIFAFLEEGKQPNDFQLLISTISEFLDYCWFHPFIADIHISSLNKEQSRRDLQTELDALDGTLSRINDLTDMYRFGGYHYSSIAVSDSSKYLLDILYTIAEICGIQKENDLGFYGEKLNNSGKIYAKIKDVPKGDNFVNLGVPNLEILEKCGTIGSAFDQDYEIRDISTFDFTKHKELEFDLARTLRCCICNILNTRLTEDIVVTLQGHGGSPSSYENDNIKRKFLDAMIIEIWAICGGLVIERKTYSDLRFQFSIESMQLERDRPKSAFRTKKTQ